ARRRAGRGRRRGAGGPTWSRLSAPRAPEDVTRASLHLNFHSQRTRHALMAGGGQSRRVGGRGSLRSRAGGPGDVAGATAPSRERGSTHLGGWRPPETAAVTA